MLAALLWLVSHEQMDHDSWLAARGRGRRLFIEERVLHAGAALGAALAAWNTLVGGTFGDYHTTRIVLEGVYYLAGSMGLSGLAAALEWRSMHRRFGRG